MNKAIVNEGPARAQINQMQSEIKLLKEQLQARVSRESPHTCPVFSV